MSINQLIPTDEIQKLISRGAREAQKLEGHNRVGFHDDLKDLAYDPEDLDSTLSETDNKMPIKTVIGEGIPQIKIDKEEDIPLPTQEEIKGYFGNNIHNKDLRKRKNDAGKKTRRKKKNLKKKKPTKKIRNNRKKFKRTKKK